MRNYHCVGGLCQFTFCFEKKTSLAFQFRDSNRVKQREHYYQTQLVTAAAAEDRECYSLVCPFAGCLLAETVKLICLGFYGYFPSLSADSGFPFLPLFPSSHTHTNTLTVSSLHILLLNPL